ncbi:MAG: hypothetical protein LBE08_08755 [Bifidobacteriaceae bacterium]|nr:hypothetical protein [Bifidobacteriaceae bacterium]
MLLNDLGDNGGVGFGTVLSAQVLVVGSVTPVREVIVRELSQNGVGSLARGGIRSLGPNGVRANDIRVADLIVIAELDEPQDYLVNMSVEAVGITQILPVLRVGDELMFGPWQDRGGPARIPSLLMRMTDNSVTGVDEWWRATAGMPVANSTSAAMPQLAKEIIASTAAFEAFCRLGGIRLREDPAIVRLDVNTLEMTAENAPDHPCALKPGVPQVPTAAMDGETAGGTQYDCLSTLSGRVAGAIGRFADDDVPQIPVRVGLVEYPLGGSVPVVGFSSADLQTARVDAAHNALRHYALDMARRAAKTNAVRAKADFTSFDTTLIREDGVAMECVSAVDLTGSSSGHRVLVPIDAALAGPWDLQTARYVPDWNDVSVAAASEDSAHAALLRALGASAVREAEAGRVDVLQVLPEEVFDAAGSEGSSLVRSLLAGARSFGLDPTVLVVDREVPTVLVEANENDGRALVGVGDTVLGAVENALTSVVGLAQIGKTQWRQAGTKMWRIPSSCLRRCPGSDLVLGSIMRHVSETPLLETAIRRGHHPVLVDITPLDLRGLVLIARVLLVSAPELGGRSLPTDSPQAKNPVERR